MGEEDYTEHGPSIEEQNYERRVMQILNEEKIVNEYLRKKQSGKANHSNL